MINDYVEKINTQKEVLQALPTNNIKNKKNYNEEVGKLISLYNEDKKLILEEITKRNNGYCSCKKDDSINIGTDELNNLLDSISLLNIYNSSYEKSSLDKKIYDLENFSDDNINKVNDNIFEIIKIFDVVNVKLSKDNFKYSYYANLYMCKFMESYDSDKDSLVSYFEKIYWKCPNIINHIALNFKYLYYANKKKFDVYYDDLVKKYNSNNIIGKYSSLYTELEEKKRSDKYLLLNNFLDGSLNINDYSDDKISKLYSSFTSGTSNNEVNEEVIKLYYSLNEYKCYLKYKYIIDDIKKLYAEKDKYKGIYNSKKKEISKLEKSKDKINNKIKKCIKKNNMNKFAFLNGNINNNIDELKKLYLELENNYFLEKIYGMSEENTLYDVMMLISSNYNYLVGINKDNDIDIECLIKEINIFICNPYNSIFNNIWINEDKDIASIIVDRYNLFNFNINKDLLDEGNIDTFINCIDAIINSIYMKKNDITFDKVKFILDSNKIL